MPSRKLKKVTYLFTLVERLVRKGRHVTADRPPELSLRGRGMENQVTVTVIQLTVACGSEVQHTTRCGGTKRVRKGVTKE